MCGEKNLFRLMMLMLVAFCVILPAGIMAQDDEAVEEELPDLSQLCSEVEKEYKNRRERDVDRIVAVYQIFDENYEKFPEKDQKKIVKCIRKGFDIKPPPEDKGFLITGAAALSTMGKKGMDALLSALKSKNLKPKDRKNAAEVKGCLSLKAAIIESIGMTKQTDALKHLQKLLWDDHADVIDASCKALANYNELPLKQRKPIVGELVKVYNQMHSLALANPKIPIYRDKLIQVEARFNDSLQKLTYQSFQTAPEWQKWYNDNKGKKKW